MPDDSETLDVRYRRREAAKMFAGALLFVALAAWIVTLDGRGALHGPSRYDWAMPWMPWIGILFFGACAVICARATFDGRVQVSIGHMGLRYRRWSDAEIPWSEISSVKLKTYRGNRIVAVRLRDPGRYPGRGLFGRLAWMNQRMGFGDVAIATSALDHTADEILEAIKQHRRAAG